MISVSTNSFGGGLKRGLRGLTWLSDLPRWVADVTVVVKVSDHLSPFVRDMGAHSG